MLGRSLTQRRCHAKLERSSGRGDEAGSTPALHNDSEKKKNAASDNKEGPGHRIGTLPAPGPGPSPRVLAQTASGAAAWGRGGAVSGAGGLEGLVADMTRGKDGKDAEAKKISSIFFES